MMFLSEQRGEIVLPKADAKPQPGKRKIGARTTSTKDIQTELTRPIAEPEYVNGVKMISAFLCNNDCDFTAAEALGVIIECKFDSIAVALIPVDKIMDVAALSNVTNIEVAEMMTLYNDEQRTFTNTDDVLCNTNAAQALGITTPYTGKGVILGIIDQGIDFQHKAFKDKNGNTRIKQASYNHIECYNLKGERLWYIDLGPNMVSGPDEQYDAVGYDWDGDGKAEVLLRGADNMIIHYADGTVQNIGNMNVNTRNMVNQTANMTYTNTGAEYLLYLEGATGKPYPIGTNLWRTFLGKQCHYPA